MTNKEAINWLINLTADIGKSEHHDLWHYEQALYEVKEMLEGKDTSVPSRKGVFIPDITVEMFRNASLEGVEDLMASGEMEYISLPSAQPDLPSAQPKRETGKWIKLGRWGRNYKCNRCNNGLDFNGVNAGRGNANFCPNCGAEMGEQENDN